MDVYIYREDNYIKTVTLTAANNWGMELTDLPGTDSNGNEIEYTFAESSDSLHGKNGTEYELDRTKSGGAYTAHGYVTFTEEYVNENTDEDGYVSMSYTFGATKEELKNGKTGNFAGRKPDRGELKRGTRKRLFAILSFRSLYRGTFLCFRSKV